MPRMLPAICDEALAEAVRVLRACSHPRGFHASARPEGYPQVWARDSMITLLGASLVDDPTIRRAAQASVESLRGAQRRLGEIPNNVDGETGMPNYQAWADSGTWYILGVAALSEGRGRLGFARRHYSAVVQALEWYAHHDVDGSHLVTMDEGTDWQDLLAVRGKGLTVNVLHVAALRAAARMAVALGQHADARKFRRRAVLARHAVNRALWYEGDGEVVDRLAYTFGTERDRARLAQGAEGRALRPKRILLDESYYLPYLAFRAFGEWFDGLGHMLAVLTGVAQGERAIAILETAQRLGLPRPYPSRAIHPAIQPGDADWRDYYEYDGLNRPGQYHNGGIWPFVGGFHVAALARLGRWSEAAEMLVSLAQANEAGTSRWGFHEWLRAETGAPAGKVEQAWSAGMYIYAHHCVATQRVPYLRW